MRVNILLLFFFISLTLAALGLDDIERIGGTQLNGNGCVCHTIVESPNVNVWIEGPDTMIAGQSAIYKMFMSGGPAIAGGYNVAVRFGLLDTLDNLSILIDNELTQNFPLPFTSTNDTIFWPFLYTAPDSINFDTLYSVGLSTNWDTIPDERDLWAYGPKFAIRIIENVIPVELKTFTASLEGNTANLSWSTSTEKNNKGFEVERCLTQSAPGGLSSERSPSDKGEGLNGWKMIGFVEGKGTTTQASDYSFVDKNLSAGKYSYRLKQIDFDGTFAYSKIISIDYRNIVLEFSLEQNYPNPFNPYTRIQYQVSRYSHISIKVYDVLGNEVAMLVDEDKSAGRYEVEFSVLDGPASSIKHIASGIYYYRFQAGEISETKKMILLR